MDPTREEDCKSMTGNDDPELPQRRKMSATSKKSPTVSSSVPGKAAAAKKTKFHKAPLAPKRFRPAFIFFSAERHREIRNQLGANATRERSAIISKRVSEEWKKLSAEERSKWDDMALVDKTRYNMEKSRYKGPWRVQKERKMKDVNAPKRPMSAFLAFANSRRADLKRFMPTSTNSELSRTLSAMWKDAPEEIRNAYIKEEHEKRAVYLALMAEWKKANEGEGGTEKGETPGVEGRAEDHFNTEAAALCSSQKAAAATKGSYLRDLDDSSKVGAKRGHEEDGHIFFQRITLPAGATESLESPASKKKPQGAGTTNTKHPGVRPAPGTLDSDCLTPALDTEHPFSLLLDRYNQATSAALSAFRKALATGDRPFPGRYVPRSTGNQVRLSESNLAYNLAAPSVLTNPLSFSQALSLTPSSLRHAMLPAVTINDAASIDWDAMGHLTLNDLRRSGLTITTTDAFQQPVFSLERLAAAAAFDQRLDTERSRSLLILENQRNDPCMGSLQGRIPFIFQNVDGAGNRIPGWDFAA